MYLLSCGRGIEGDVYLLSCGRGIEAVKRIVQFVAELVCSSGRRAVLFARHVCNINTY